MHRTTSSLDRRNKGFRDRCPLLAAALLACSLLLAGCAGTGPAKIARGKMGEKVKVEQIAYTVLDAQWTEALGDGPTARIPEHRFLLLRIAATNEGGSAAEMGGLKLLSQDGTEYDEIATGTGVTEWMGMARQLDAGASKQGVVLFDAPKAVYELQVADAFYDGETGSAALIQIPVRPETAEPAVSGALP